MGRRAVHTEPLAPANPSCLTTGSCVARHLPDPDSLLVTQRGTWYPAVLPALRLAGAGMGMEGCQEMTGPEPGGQRGGYSSPSTAA